jgi:ATP-binding cassette, subfamily C, bacterial
MSDPRAERSIRHFIRAYPRKTALIVVLLLLSGLAEGVGVVTLLPLLELTTGSLASTSSVSGFVSRILAGNGVTPRLEVLLGMIVAGMVLKAVFYLLAMKQVGYTVAYVAADLRLTLIRALLRARWSYFTSQPAGRISNAIGSEALRAAESYRAVCSVFASCMQVLIYGFIAVLVSWRIAAFAILGGGLVVLVLSRLVDVARRAGATQTRLMSSLISRLVDALQGIKPIKAMGREEHLQPLLEAETRGINRAQEQAVLAAEAIKSAQEPLLAAMMAVALYFALTAGNQSFATVLVVAFLFYRLAGRVTVVQIDYQTAVAKESAFWSMRESILAAEAHRESETGGMHSPTLRHEIAFDNVAFSYGERSILNGISLRIPAGSFVALLGPSGAGKTTLVDLLVGLYTPDQGQIRVDGVPLSELDVSAWRQMIGYVPQEMFLFHDTVYQNISLGDPSVSPEDAREALRTAGAWEFVAKLPLELETVMGERGSRLSGGQRQRIALARALARKPKLLVLDEVTASLDPGTEAEICEALRGLHGRVTVISISHQPAMMEAADLVFRVDAGQAREALRPASWSG